MLPKSDSSLRCFGVTLVKTTINFFQHLDLQQKLLVICMKATDK